jgi:predicted metalloprotease with PDZ domain
VGSLARAFTLDTGCHLYGAGAITKREFDQLLARGELSLAETLPTSSAFGFGEDRAGVLALPVLVADHRHVGLAFVETKNDEVAENTLGFGFLRRYVVTFDFPHHAVYLAPGENFQQIDASHDSGGFRVRRDGNRIVVSNVGWRCPASKAGVKVNDVLVEINGIATAKLDNTALTEMLSRSDRPVSLTFRRSSDESIYQFVYDERVTRHRARNRLSGSEQNAGKQSASAATGQSKSR